jgi:O-antigen ligase
MERLKSFGGLAGLEAPSAQRFACWFLILVSFLVTAIIAPMLPVMASIAIVATWAALLWIALALVNNYVDKIVVYWLALSPYLYYYLVFPEHTPVITPDRILVFILCVFMFIAWRSARLDSIPNDARLSAYFWILYLLICVISLRNHPISHELFGSYRLLLEGLVFPFIIGIYAVLFFDLRKNIYILHSSICLLSLGICIISIIEFITGQNIFPWAGSGEYIAGTLTQVIRPDGPYEQPAILSAIGILLFFLLVYLRTLMSTQPGAKRKIIHEIGLWCSLIAALAPLDRGVVIILGIIAFIDIFPGRRIVPYRIWAILFGGIVLLALFARIAYPDVYADRTTDTDNIYQRLAQNKETIQVIQQHPFLGVGVSYYNYFVSQDPQYLVRWHGVESMNVQHNLIMTVLSEEGIIGCLLFTCSQIFMIRGMWKARKKNHKGWLVFIYCISSYWLLGMDFALNYYADVNLIYLFIIGLLYHSQYGISPVDDNVQYISVYQNV